MSAPRCSGHVGGSSAVKESMGCEIIAENQNVKAGELSNGRSGR
jgi:hypothetical protein